MPDPIPERAMVVVAHPDDPEFSTGGTVGLWTGQGAEVVYVIVSDGSKGTDDRTITPERLSARRREEQHNAAQVLGVRDVTFLEFTDGEIRPDLAVRFAIAREIRRWRPDTVITHDPARLYFDNYINHPDHRAVGEAALYAIFPTARDHLNAPYLLAEGFEPHKVRQIYLTGACQPDTWLDIGPTIDRKIEALRQHASQIADPDGLANRIRQRAADIADGHGMEYAEAFKRIVLDR
jgi:LmbE family N-acetylglucosaminyl deacetylase